ncbi:efflux RND transporter periplasmic adaptor subunit [Methylobacterium sp. J-026]|uniref:efflux RND transporter periplasmic adaptor subunit n=1 Tax=Methylobacterium sp. J-026 TaxID=2836624 RepID=UPI001FBAA58F|nr:efflux RND transporter periplasmic adaptor subunit [Methylobacterium sp. J-026]MCJ2134075.1 efflux RND transporter periplasmic adaptor subunit [Methylobacterium sp. J-026]
MKFVTCENLYPAAVVLVGCGLLAAGLAACQPNGNPPGDHGQGGPPNVSVLTVTPRSVARTITIPGRTAATMTADVRPQVSGVILKRLFIEGADVTEGQQLYQIDPATYQAALDSARGTLAHNEASLTTATVKSGRYKSLVGMRAVSSQDYDDAVASAKEATADIQTARASVEQARINLEYTKVLAPISGRIGRSTVTAGSLAVSNQTSALATITKLDPIYVDLNQSTVTLLRLRRELASGEIARDSDGGAKVTLLLEDGSLYPQAGKLAFSEVTVDQGTGTVLVRAVFPNPDHLLLPGMYVRAEIQEGVDHQGILLPQTVVSRNAHGDPTVLVLGDGDTAQLRAIQAGPAIGTDWLITGGLKAGEKVIADNLMKVRPGARVQPAPSASAPLDPLQP